MHLLLSIEVLLNQYPFLSIEINHQLVLVNAGLNILIMNFEPRVDNVLFDLFSHLLIFEFQLHLPHLFLLLLIFSILDFLLQIDLHLLDGLELLLSLFYQPLFFVALDFESTEFKFKTKLVEFLLRVYGPSFEPRH